MAKLNEIDARVNARIKERRLSLGLSRQQFADLLDVSYALIRKYDEQQYRVFAGRLYEIAEILSVPIEFFYEEIDKTTQSHVSRQRLLLEMTRSFVAIQNERHKEAVSKLAQALAGE